MRLHTDAKRQGTNGGVAADTKGLLSSGKLQLRIIMLYILRCIWVFEWVEKDGNHTTHHTVSNYINVSYIRNSISCFCCMVSCVWLYLQLKNLNRVWAACVLHMTKWPHVSETQSKNSSLLTELRTLNACACVSMWVQLRGRVWTHWAVHSKSVWGLMLIAGWCMAWTLDGVAASLVVKQTWL